MKKTRENEDAEEFKTVTVFGRLITKDDPNFDKLFGAKAEEVPVSKDEIVLPVFDLVFEDFYESPSHSTREMIRREIDESVVGDRELAELIQKTRPSRVVDMPPFGQPKTQSVEVGKIAVTPSGSGIISTFFFDELGETIESDF